MAWERGYSSIDIKKGFEVDGVTYGYHILAGSGQ